MENEGIMKNENTDTGRSAKELLVEQLRQGIMDVMDSENFRNWCAASSKLFYNNYSMRNALLVYMQKPESSHVMGYEAWKQYGRQVKKGAKGIKILAPVFFKEYGGKGRLFNSIKKALNEQLSKDPSIGSAGYRLGQSQLQIILKKNGLYDIQVGDETINTNLPEATIRKFLDDQVIGKLPAYFNVTSVFDISDVTSEVEYLWLKNGFRKSEMVLDEDNNPIKNRSGEFKIKNSPERVSRFVPSLNTSIPEADPDKMEELFSVLQSISSKNGIPMTVEQIEGTAKGFFDRSEMRIAIDESLFPTEKVAVAFHELGHSIMHKDLQNLGKEMGNDEVEITRHLKEVQAEAVAYMAANHFGINTDTSSFSYLAAWSSNRELKELEQSLDFIWKKGKDLLIDIEKELDSRGLNLHLEPKDQTPIPLEEMESHTSQGEALDNAVENFPYGVSNDNHAYSKMVVERILSSEDPIHGFDVEISQQKDNYNSSRQNEDIELWLEIGKHLTYVANARYEYMKDKNIEEQKDEKPSIDSKVQYYKFFYSPQQNEEAVIFQNETGWNRIWASDSHGVNGDTWIVYRGAEDLPKNLCNYAVEQESLGEAIKADMPSRIDSLKQDSMADSNTSTMAEWKEQIRQERHGNESINYSKGEKEHLEK